ncbi:MAG: hypothetical protein CM1200mP28_02220 [Deltaproteobacteria bacterium]|nr:MAG: hypothetical protein CM1200mP28_02220 [Deltaproteobacteria bacterium]
MQGFFQKFLSNLRHLLQDGLEFSPCCRCKRNCGNKFRIVIKSIPLICLCPSPVEDIFTVPIVFFVKYSAPCSMSFFHIVKCTGSNLILHLHNLSLPEQKEIISEKGKSESVSSHHCAGETHSFLIQIWTSQFLC